MHYIKKISILFISFIISLFGLCNISYGAIVKDVEIHGYESKSEEVRDIIDHSLSIIPNDVLKYYNKLDGEIYLIDGPLYNKYQYDNVNNDTIGLYFSHSNEIAIRTDILLNIDSSNVYSRAILHEFGHFLYNKTYLYLYEESKNKVKENYEYYKNYNPACYNEDETFAELYSWYLSGNTKMLDNDTIEMYKESENICSILINNNIEQGPGMIELVNDKK